MVVKHRDNSLRPSRWKEVSRVDTINHDLMLQCVDRRVYLYQMNIIRSEEEAVQIFQAQSNDVHKRFAELAGKH